MECSTPSARYGVAMMTTQDANEDAVTPTKARREPLWVYPVVIVIVVGLGLYQVFLGASLVGQPNGAGDALAYIAFGVSALSIALTFSTVLGQKKDARAEREEREREYRQLLDAIGRVKCGCELDINSLAQEVATRIPQPSKVSVESLAEQVVTRLPRLRRWARRLFTE